MTKYSTEYFIPIEHYPLGVHLKCNNNTITNGTINVYHHVYSKYVGYLYLILINLKLNFNKFFRNFYLECVYSCLNIFFVI